jgi:hypothetical protein
MAVKMVEGQKALMRYEHEYLQDRKESKAGFTINDSQISLASWPLMLHNGAWRGYHTERRL